jgi:hypothetical protein
MIACDRCGTLFAVAPWNDIPIRFPLVLPAHPGCPPPDADPHPGVVLAPHLGWLPDPAYGTPESLVGRLGAEAADRDASIVPVRDWVDRPRARTNPHD